MVESKSTQNNIKYKYAYTVESKNTQIQIHMIKSRI